MDWTLLIAIVSLILNLIFVPLFILVWKNDREVIELKSTKITKQDLENLYTVLNEIKNDFVHIRTCDSRHNK